MAAETNVEVIESIMNAEDQRSWNWLMMSIGFATSFVGPTGICGPSEHIGRFEAVVGRKDAMKLVNNQRQILLVNSSNRVFFSRLKEKSSSA